jgi:tRNA(fMet)-specific endonuclease VapC
MIIDTNALSAFAEGHPRIRERISGAAGPYLPVIVLGEYRFGLLNARERQKRLAWLEKLAQLWVVLEITQKTTVHYAEIRRRLKENATPIPSNDTWIAALALEHSLPVLSDDPHFDLVTGIERIGLDVSL